MKSICKIAVFAIAGTMVLLSAVAVKAEEIGKITKFEGKVIVVSGEKASTVTKVGHVINASDKIQTEQGTAEITFNDEALLKVSPYTTASVDERKEEKGMIFFKKQENVRRVTDMVGKVWFKSGTSDKKNYLQTPTAVCALRGSDGDLGFDGNNAYLNMYSGQANTVGDVVRQAFGDFGRDVAQRSSVYQAVTKALEMRSAVQPGDLKAARLAEMGMQQALKAAAEAMQTCPDPQVQAYAAVAMVVSDAKIAAVQSQQIAADAAAAVVVAQQTLAAAQAAGQAETIAAAQAALQTVQTLSEQAATTAAAVTIQAQAAFDAISGGSMAGMAAAQTAAEGVVSQVQTLVESAAVLNIVPPPPPVVVPPPPVVVPPPTGSTPPPELPPPPPPPVPTIYQNQ